MFRISYQISMITILLSLYACNTTLFKGKSKKHESLTATQPEVPADPCKSENPPKTCEADVVPEKPIPPLDPCSAANPPAECKNEDPCLGKNPPKECFPLCNDSKDKDGKDCVDPCQGKTPPSWCEKPPVALTCPPQGTVNRKIYICGMVGSPMERDEKGDVIETKWIIEVYQGNCPNGAGQAKVPRVDPWLMDTYIFQDQLDKIDNNPLKVPGVDHQQGVPRNHCFVELYVPASSCIDYYYYSNKAKLPGLDKSRGWDKIGTFCDHTDPNDKERRSDIGVYVGENQADPRGWSWFSDINPETEPGAKDFCKYGYKGDGELHHCVEKAPDFNAWKSGGESKGK